MEDCAVLRKTKKEKVWRTEVGEGWRWLENKSRLMTEDDGEEGNVVDRGQ